MIFKVEQKYANLRLDKTLIEVYAAATFSLVQKLCRKGQIRLDGKRVKGHERLEVGQEIKLPDFLLKEQPLKTDKASYQMSKKEIHSIENMIVYQDESIILLNKEYGLPVQAGSGHSKSLDRMLKAYAGEAYEPKLVHRIDKTTTGLVLFAKGKQSARDLAHAFKTRQVEKAYLAVVKGRVKASEMEGLIESELAVEETDGIEKIAVKKGQQKAQTEYEIIQSAGMYHLLKVKPKTGRKHQIRVHLSSINLPIVGDIKYGGEKFETDDKKIKNKLFLHAFKLSLKEGGNLYKADIPEHFSAMLKLMQWKL